MLVEGMQGRIAYFRQLQGLEISSHKDNGIVWLLLSLIDGLVKGQWKPVDDWTSLATYTEKYSLAQQLERRER